MMTKNKMEHHLEQLRQKHKDLELDLMEADAHYEDNQYINRIKKKKLKIKDEMTKCQNQILGL